MTANTEFLRAQLQYNHNIAEGNTRFKSPAFPNETEEQTAARIQRYNQTILDILSATSTKNKAEVDTKHKVSEPAKLSPLTPSLSSPEPKITFQPQTISSSSAQITDVAAKADVAPRRKRAKKGSKIKGKVGKNDEAEVAPAETNAVSIAKEKPIQAQFELPVIVPADIAKPLLPTANKVDEMALPNVATPPVIIPPSNPEEDQAKEAAQKLQQKTFIEKKAVKIQLVISRIVGIASAIFGVIALFTVPSAAPHFFSASVLSFALNFYFGRKDKNMN